MSTPTVADRMPATVAEAEALYVDLHDACVEIQAQLSNKDHVDEFGERLPEHEYHQWRAKATWALSKKRIQMGRLKRWLDERKQEAVRIEAGVENPSNAVELFGALLRIARASSTWKERTPRDQAVIDLAERWVRKHGAHAVVTAREKTAKAVAR